MVKNLMDESHETSLNPAFIVYMYLLCPLEFVVYFELHIYRAKVLTDHPKNCDNFVVQYFGLTFGTLNENTIWHQSCASAGILHSVCSLRMCIHIKPFKRMCNSRNNLNLNSNHGNLNNNVFSLK